MAIECFQESDHEKNVTSVCALSLIAWNEMKWNSCGDSEVDQVSRPFQRPVQTSQEAHQMKSLGRATFAQAFSEYWGYQPSSCQSSFFHGHEDSFGWREKKRKGILIGNGNIPHKTKRGIHAKADGKSCFDIWILMTPWHPHSLGICFQNVTAGCSGNYWISTFIEKQHIQYRDNCPVGYLWRMQGIFFSFYKYRNLVIIN